MKLKEYRAISKIDNKWKFAIWLIKTKEFKWILLVVAALWIATMIINPQIAVTIRNFIFQKLFGITL
jgi:hypothetical protein